MRGCVLRMLNVRPKLILSIERTKRIYSKSCQLDNQSCINQNFKKNTQCRLMADCIRCLVSSNWTFFPWPLTFFLYCCSSMTAANLMAVFSVASGSSAAGRSSARISSGLRGSFRGGFCSLPLIPIPAVMAFHKALWDFEPAKKKKKSLRYSHFVMNQASICFPGGPLHCLHYRQIQIC